ncbi:MAG: DUF4395 domain-containing protein [Thiotrichales bacterium]|nr:DUF4395 domain-containing protein [Thiotrichales bacterium]
MLNAIKNLWFRDPAERPAYINDTAVRIRAGMLLFIPIIMLFTLFDAIYVSNWVVDGNTAVDTYDTNWDDQIIYQVEAVRRTYDYTIQSWILVYAFFEMLISMSVRGSRLSPTVLIASILASRQPAVWKPLAPKRFAWTIGATMIATCWIYFNPEIFAHWVNTVSGSDLLPTTENYMSYYIPLLMVWVCFGFMWLEAMLGYCVGCKVHALFVKIGIIKEECAECNNIDWDEIARKHKAKQEAEAATNKA